MKINPVVLSTIETRHTSFEVKINIESNITFVVGESGVGKSALFTFLEELAAEDNRIRCINYLDQKKNYKNTIRLSKAKLFVIDNADILLDDAIREYIALDTKNQYLIIGRNPKGLLLDQNNYYELKSLEEAGKTILTLVRTF